MVLKNIFFKSGEVELLPSSMPEFERLIKFMQQYPKINIMVIGHTDNVGDSEYNLQLSQMRSKFLVDKLIEYGVSPERLDFAERLANRPVI